jgi:polyisoprenoid-binding protein YceI
VSTTTPIATALPIAGTYAVDPSHSHVGFKARHLVVAKVRGRFAEFEGTVTIADEPLESSVDVTVQLASIDTRDEKRDEHLRSGDFFDVDQHPTLTFRSTGVRPVGDDVYDVDGELTVHGITRPLTLRTTFEGTARDPWGGERAAFSATARLDRNDFGLTWNQALETGGVLVGKDIDIDIEAEIVRS